MLEAGREAERSRPRVSGTCNNGFDLISPQRASPLGRGKGLQKPQLQLRQRAAPDRRGWDPPPAVARFASPRAALSAPACLALLINGCLGLWWRGASSAARWAEGKRTPPRPNTRALACKRGRRCAAALPSSPPLAALPCVRECECVCLRRSSRPGAGTSAGGEPVATDSPRTRSLLPLRSSPAAAAAASAVAAGHGPARTGPRRHRVPEPRSGCCLSRAARGASAAAGGGWGCPGCARSPQGERGAGAQPENRAARAGLVGPCARRAPGAAAAAAAARASMAPSPRRR
ncbi:uncharacterized protein V5649_002225 [Rhynchonycteris naso]